MTIIIGIAGKKQSGKDTLCEYFKHLYLSGKLSKSSLKNYEVIQEGNGKVRVYDPGTFEDMTGFYNVGGELHNASIKVYSFADELKEFLINVLGVERTACYGTDVQKNANTRFNIEKIPDIMLTQNLRDKLSKDKNAVFTGRELMQFFGTDVCRKLFDDKVWVNATLRKILRESPDVALIADVRFQSEVEAILNQENSYCIRLTRDFDTKEIHKSEIDLDNYNWDQWNDEFKRTFIIDNANLNMEQKNKEGSIIFNQIIGE
jgi:hypothetical protein